MKIQKLLGEKDLSVNPGKTLLSTDAGAAFDEDLEEVKSKLLQRRRRIVAIYDDDPQEIELDLELDEDEMEYLKDLLNRGSLEEEDAELVLTVMRRHSEEVEDHLHEIGVSFPHLAKNIFQFCEHIADKDNVAQLVTDLASDPGAQEFQIFWYAYILQRDLLDTAKAPEIIERLFNHVNATHITRAKILEIPDPRYGLTELRDSHLGAGRSDWLAWASAAGHRCLKKISRNHKLTYFAKASHINYLIYRVVSDLPD